MRGLKDRVVVANGGGGGIGPTTCEMFGKEGTHLVAADIKAEAAQAVLDRITAAGGRAAPRLAGSIRALAPPIWPASWARNARARPGI